MLQQGTSAENPAKLDEVLQRVAEHKGCGTSGGSGKASCGSGAGQNDLAPEIWEKVKNHTCYSEEAHHHYARMHVAVAPACNIQCNYCNRKYEKSAIGWFKAYLDKVGSGQIVHQLRGDADIRQGAYVAA